MGTNMIATFVQESFGTPLSKAFANIRRALARKRMLARDMILLEQVFPGNALKLFTQISCLGRRNTALQATDLSAKIHYARKDSAFRQGSVKLSFALPKSV